MKERYKIFPFIFIIALIAIVLTLFFKGILYTLILSFSIGILLFFTKAIWLPRNSKYTVRLLSITVAVTLALSFGAWNIFLESLFRSYFPVFMENYQSIPPILLLLFLTSIIWIVNFYNRDNSAMGKHPNPIIKDIPDISYNDSIKGIVSSLSDDLRSIDIRTNWSSNYFTPLDAEVEIITKNGKVKKIIDLISAIKKSKDRLFLVLGDPGSGKSVALRKLCQDLSSEVILTGKIPIYINLKEWQTDEPWSEKNLPTIEHLTHFIISNIRNRDIYISKFFGRKIDDNTTYFDRLYQSGRLFFVLDSFDEIPSVLNEQENSWLIKELSKVIFTFLKGSRLEESKGVLASRQFRKPTPDYQCNTILEIRPFTEKKIIATFKRSNKIDAQTIRAFFKNYSYLVPIARNPFTATLITEYIENKSQLPKSHNVLYENYIDLLLDSCIDRLQKHNLEKSQVVDFAIEVASMMYEKKHGWEISISYLRTFSEKSDIIIDILKFIRIGRGVSGDESKFSFVHRRFAEYFMVKKMLNDKTKLDLQSIPRDSQLRDALILYCEVADFNISQNIAMYCWNIIKNTNNPNNIETIQAIRFLRDAFKSRKDCIAQFENELYNYVKKELVESNNNMINIKLSIECVSLLNDHHRDEIIKLALQLDNFWINETAFYSSRNLPELSDDLKNSYFKFFNGLDIFSIKKSYSDYKFSLSLSDAFIEFKKFIRFRLIDFNILKISILLSLLLFPIEFIITIIILLLEFLAASINKKESNIVYKILRITPFLLPFVYRYILSDLNEVEITYYILNLFNLPPYLCLGIILLLQLFFLSNNRVRNILLSKIKINLVSIFKAVSKVSTSVKYLKTQAFYLIIGIMLSILISKYDVLEFLYSNTFFKNVMLSIILLILLIGLISGVIRSLILVTKRYLKYKSDCKILKDLHVENITDRRKVYQVLKSLTTEKAKLNFLNSLDIYANSIKGEWPKKDMLKMSNQRSTIKLNQLEEKWLGLNR